MKILVIDPSGKVPQYDNALCNALAKEADIEFASPYNHRREYNVNFKFIRMAHIPDIWRSKSLKIWKSIEVLVNYLYISFLLLFKHYDVVHLQWLPFLEYVGIEKYFLKLFHLFSPKTNFVLTQHNLYPHNSSNSKKEKYYNRMQEIKRYFSHFIVHTESSKDAFCKEYGIDNKKVSVVSHGLFEPQTMPNRKTPSNPIRLLIFGNQTKYKGTDILIDAIALLPEDIRKKIHLTIAGQTDTELYAAKKVLAGHLGIEWIAHFLSNEELNQLIVDADILLLPYRAISQSGVLLLSLSFKKHLIVSDLPSFVETLEGYPDECFVKVGSADSLAKAITLYVDGKVDLEKERAVNQLLLEKYSWKRSAQKNIELYYSLLN